MYKAEILILPVKTIDFHFSCSVEFSAMKCQFQAHSDMINTLEMCERNERVLVISASSDCSVAMYDVLGNLIGIFGQVWRRELIYMKSLNVVVTKI